MHFSVLNEDHFKHAFECLITVSSCGKENENSKNFLHCLLLCVLFTYLFDQLSDAPGLVIASINNMDDDTLCHRLMLGDPSSVTIESRVMRRSHS